MRSLNALARRSLARRKARYALTASGIALGVAVLFGVLVASDAMTSSLDRIVHQSRGEVDVQVGVPGSFDGTLPAGTEQRVAALPDVVRTIGEVGLRTSIVTGERSLAELEADTGSLVDDEFVIVLGTDLAAKHDLVGLPAADGRLPERGAAELAITDGVARDYDIGVGDEVKLATPRGSFPMAVVGLLADRGAGVVPDFVYTSLETGQQLLGKGDVLNGINVVLADGVDPDDWIDDQRDGIGESLLLQPADESAQGFRTFITSVNTALTLTSAIALFVGGFLVFLTFSLAVAERVRDHGTLRALGAQPRQVRRVVVVEAVVLGGIASIGGLLLGYVIAIGVVGLSESLFGFEAGSIGMPLTQAVLSVVVALAVSAVAAWVPARRAAALSPVVAMRVSAAEGTDRSGRPVLATVLLVLGTVLGLGDRSTAVRSVAVIVVLLGAVLAVPLVLGPLARVVGRATRRLAPGVGAIAVLHLVKERSRSAYTLALVMVVLGMLIAVGATNAAMSRTLDDVVRRQSGSGLQVLAPNAFDPEVEGVLAGIPGVDTLTPLRLGQAELVDDEDSTENAFLAVIEPDSYFEIAGLPWIDGDDAQGREGLRRGGTVALPQPTARRLNAEVGDEVAVRTLDGVRRFEVIGTYAYIQGYGLVAGEVDADLFGATRANGFLVGLDDGADPTAVRKAVLAEIGPTYDATVSTTEQTLEDARAQLQGFFGIGYAMLGIAGVVGVLGLANTLVVSVLTRSREIGILRTTGARRRRVAGMVLVEAATLVSAAVLLAAPLGAVLAFGIIDAQRATLGFTLEFTYPWALLPPLAITTLVLAALAALVPARRAARLEIVETLRFD
ncbi:MAG TPA: FtsX-like permease family protein [Acidimicrobiales bacterium]|nr:FtsX-like permease family protein [Acidimicrobiales bacterium]